MAKNPLELVKRMNDDNGFKPRYYKQGEDYYRINQRPNGKFYNEYDIQYSRPNNQVVYFDQAGDFDSLEDAETALNKHRPNSVYDENITEEQIYNYAKGKADNLTATNLLKDYYDSKMDLDTLHDQLTKTFGGVKPAFEWLLKNSRR